MYILTQSATVVSESVAVKELIKYFSPPTETIGLVEITDVVYQPRKVTVTRQQHFMSYL